jgi:N-acetylmuramoyl-L-alanine amidase
VVLAALVALVLLLGSEQPRADGAESTLTGPMGEGAPTTGPATPTTTAPPTVTTSSTATTTTKAPTTDTPVSVPPVSSSTTGMPTTTDRPSTTSTAPGAGYVVVIDPGHQGKGNPAPEPIGPGAAQTKPKVSSGTAGVSTGIPESELVLAVSLKLRDILDAAGVQVVMTRTTQDVDLSNIQRAQIANQAGADLFVRVHADGSDDPATTGIHVLYPASTEGWTDDIVTASKRAASVAQRELVAATGAKDRGIDARSDMTGFNWSDVPAIIPEIGFMTNPAEDRRLATSSYQDAIVAGLARAILVFLRGE